MKCIEGHILIEHYTSDLDGIGGGEKLFLKYWRITCWVVSKWSILIFKFRNWSSISPWLLIMKVWDSIIEVCFDLIPNISAERELYKAPADGVDVDCDAPWELWEGKVGRGGVFQVTSFEGELIYQKVQKSWPHWTRKLSHV